MKRVLARGPLFQRQQLRLVKPFSATATQVDIPKRIPRGPTDILQALKSTVKTDPTAASYKYIDDPVMIPAANIDKRSFALARESGKKAAKYFLKTYPACFERNDAVPNIPAFNAPHSEYALGQKNTLDDLTSCIASHRVSDAEIVYRNLNSEGVEIPDETLLLLLQLSSFYNSTAPLDEDLTEEKWYRRSQTLGKKTWNDGGLPEQIFEKLANKEARAYSALIQGMLKYFQVDKGFSLYTEMQDKGLVPSLHTFNYLLARVVNVRENSATRWELTQQILEHMVTCNVTPNLTTFNNILFVCSRLGSTKNAKNVTLRTLAEMKALGIAPSLATFDSVVSVFCHYDSSDASVLTEILDLIEKDTIEIKDERDTYFFMSAMSAASKLMNKELGYRINELAHKNFHMIGDAFNESVYYQHFFRLLCASEDLDKFMRIYQSHVPNVYTPEPTVMEAILEAVQMNGAVQYVHHLWSDVVAFQQIERENLLGFITSIIASVDSNDKALVSQCEAVAIDVVKRVDELNENREKYFRAPIALTAAMISELLVTFVKADNFQMAQAMFGKLSDSKNNVIGVPKIEALETYSRYLANLEDLKGLMECAVYCSDLGYGKVVELIRDTATENHFGAEFLRELDTKYAKSLMSKE